LKKIRNTSAMAVSIVLFLSPKPTLADSDFNYLLGLSVGLRGIEFDLDSLGGPTFLVLNDGNGPVIPGQSAGKQEFDFDETLYTAGFSGTVIYERIHLSALVELPLQTEDTSLHTETTSQGGLGSPVNDSSDRDTELDRFDFSLTLGYRVWEGLSVFSGYKYSEFDLDSQEYNFLLNNKDQNYVEEGFFIGSSYAWQFGTKGSLSLSLAYAYLDTEFSEGNIAKEPPPLGYTYEEFAYHGNSNGLSYGAQWSGRLINQWVYTVGLKYQSYTSNNNATTLQPLLGDNFLSQDPDIAIPVKATPVALTKIDTKHTDATFSVGILYMFQ
jgi:hypothetical protein